MQDETEDVGGDFKAPDDKECQKANQELKATQDMVHTEAFGSKKEGEKVTAKSSLPDDDQEPPVGGSKKWDDHIQLVQRIKHLFFAFNMFNTNIM